MEKIRYEIDPYNRLILGDSGAKSDLPKFRQVIDGQFKIGENNSLSYRVKSPHHSLRSGAGQAPFSSDTQIPYQIKLNGRWSLTDDHELRLTLDGQGRQTFGDQITLQGEILDINESSLLFAVTTTTKEATRSTYLLNLAGIWKADEFNRLSFHIKKESGRYDILTFSGVWEINKNHEIIYQYEKARLIRKKRETHTLIFKGYWDIKEPLRISYLLSAGTDSGFDFNTSAGIFKEGYIKYELGIGSADKVGPVRRVVTLYGKWNMKKNIGLIFEIEYENKKTKAIIFGADARLTDMDTILFKLRNEAENKDIGVSLELSHKILKGDGEAFLRLLKQNSESAVYAGAAWRW
jgi:hypothetical protein